MKKVIKYLILQLKALIGLELSVSPEIKIDKDFFGDQYAGWTLCPNELNGNSIVYAFGIGENISFDLAMINQFGCKVHAFDPTPKSLDWLSQQKTPPEFLKHEYGIASFDGTVTFNAPSNPEHVSHSLIERDYDAESIEVPVKKLTTIMEELGHRKIDVLKMDIEGAEYDVIEDLIESKIEITQILVEFHHRFAEIDISKSRAAIGSLQAAGFKIFDVSASREEYSFIKR